MTAEVPGIVAADIARMEQEYRSRSGREFALPPQTEQAELAWAVGVYVEKAKYRRSCELGLGVAACDERLDPDQQRHVSL
jgi:hypothetical protein